MSVKNGDTLVLPESDDAFVTTSISFSKMSRRVDLLKGRGGGVVGILGFSEENGWFVDDGICAEGDGTEVSPFVCNFGMAETNKATFSAI